MIQSTFSRVVLFLNLGIVGWAILASPVNNLAYHFQEYRLVTFFSAFQLIGSALVCFFVYDTATLLKANKDIQIFERQSHYVWLLMALGFCFLAFDEVLMLHEALDFYIHQLYQLQENAWTDRIDDVVVLVYTLIAIYILLKYRKHLLIYHKIIRVFLNRAFILVFIMIILDLLTNRQDIISNDKLHQLFSVAEEICKLTAEAFLLVMFYSCWKQTLLWQISEHQTSN